MKRLFCRGGLRGLYECFYAFWSLLQLTWIRADHSCRSLSRSTSLQGLSVWYLKDKVLGGVSQRHPCTPFPLVFPLSLFFINTVCFHSVSLAFCLYFPFLREWSQPATTRSWILKSRRLLESVSAKRRRSGEWLSPSCPVSSQKCPQGALSSFMPCLTSPASLLWRWQLGSQQHCSLPPYLQGVFHFCYIMSLCTEKGK